MKLAIAFLLLLSAQHACSQRWHAALDTLRAPQSPFHTRVSMSYTNRYDTVRCIYKVIGSAVSLKGYKYVFILDGFYIDTPNTFNVFFDDRKQRIDKVESYCFN